jgi:hypothetical protein
VAAEGSTDFVHLLQYMKTREDLVEKLRNDYSCNERVYDPNWPAVHECRCYLIVDNRPREFSVVMTATSEID